MCPSFCSVIGADAGNGIRVFIPDIGMFVAGLVTWLLCRSLAEKPLTEETAQFNCDCEPNDQVSLPLLHATPRFQLFLIYKINPALIDIGSGAA